MGIVDSLSLRRSVYALGKNCKVSDAELLALVQKLTELVPDAFNMKSARVLLVTGEEHDRLWDGVGAAFGGMLDSAKLAGFRAAYGTILYFVDSAVVSALQDKFALYADNFPIWANQANGMLQISVWTALAELGLGASLQHYNPVIDATLKQMFDLPDSWVLNAQMPFGAILATPAPKVAEDISQRVRHN